MTDGELILAAGGALVAVMLISRRNQQAAIAAGAAPTGTGAAAPGGGSSALDTAAKVVDAACVVGATASGYGYVAPACPLAGAAVKFDYAAGKWLVQKDWAVLKTVGGAVVSGSKDVYSAGSTLVSTLNPWHW